MNIYLTKEGPKGLIKLPSEVDKFIKVKVVGDAIQLMRKSKYRDDRSQMKGSGCWHRILPSPDCGEYQTFSKMKFIFEKILAKPGNKAMTLTAFSKIGKIKSLKSKVTRVNLDLLYKRITQQNGSSTMDLNTFFDAIEELAMTICPVQPGKCDQLVDILLESLAEMAPVVS